MALSQPTFSIIIPTYRRPQLLSVCLDTLAKLDYPRDSFEVIVVDDGSENPPEDVVRTIQDKLDIRLLVKTHAGPAPARNFGAASAKFRFLAFTDDDCSPAPDWLTKLAERFTVNPGLGIGGRIVNALTENQYSTASQLVVEYLYTYFNADPQNARLFTASNMAFPKEEFYQAGSFEKAFVNPGGEERELCDRWIQTGHRFLYAPEVLVYHRHKLSPGSFWRQHYTYGRGAFRYRKVQAVKTQKGVPLEPLSFYWNLIRYPLMNSHTRQPWFLAALMGISQAATATGYFREKFFTPDVIPAKE